MQRHCGISQVADWTSAIRQPISIRVVRVTVPATQPRGQRHAAYYKPHTWDLLLLNAQLSHTVNGYLMALFLSLILWRDVGFVTQDRSLQLCCRSWTTWWITLWPWIYYWRVWCLVSPATRSLYSAPSCSAIACLPPKSSPFIEHAYMSLTCKVTQISNRNPHCWTITFMSGEHAKLGRGKRK